MAKLSSVIPVDLKRLANAYASQASRKKIKPVDVFLAILQLIFNQRDKNTISVPDDWKSIPGLKLSQRPSDEPGLFKQLPFPNIEMFEWFTRFESSAEEPQQLYPLLMTLLTMQNQDIEELLRNGNFNVRVVIETWIERVMASAEAKNDEPRSGMQLFEFGSSLATYLQRADLIREFRNWISDDRSLDALEQLEVLLISATGASKQNRSMRLPETSSSDIVVLALTVGIMSTKSWEIEFLTLQPTHKAVATLKAFLQG